MKAFDIEKAKNGAKVKTRRGGKARIICFDAKAVYDDILQPIIALVEYDNGCKEDVNIYCEDGSFIPGSIEDEDLVMDDKREGWINIYPNNVVSVIFDREVDADFHASSERIACVKIEWVEP